MKKYLIVLITLLSIIISYFTYKGYNFELYNNYYQYQEYIVSKENKKVIPLFLSIKNNNENFMKQFINQLVEFSDHKYTFTFIYSDYNDTTEISYFALYTQNNKIINDLKERGSTGIDFQSSESHGYYSTQINDRYAKGYIKILDNRIFDDYNNCVRIISLNDSIKDICSRKNIALYFFDEDVDKFENDFINFLEENHFDDTIAYENFFDGYSGGSIVGVILRESIKEIFLLIFYVALAYITVLLIYFTKKKKTVLIQRLHGISQIKIICREVLPLLFVHYVMFVIVYLVCMWLFTNGQMIYEQKLLKEIFIIFSGLAIIFIMIIVIVYGIVSLFISLKSLKSSSYSSRNVIYVMIIKIIVISLLTGPMIKLIGQCYDEGIYYFHILKQYDTISQLCYLNGNMKKSDNNSIVFNYYLHKNGLYCNFDTYYNNTLDTLKKMHEEIDEERLNEQALDFPVIYVNANYIKAMGQKIYTKNGTELDLDKFDKDKMLVPHQYMSGRLENVLIFGSQIQGEIETIEIKDTGTYVNYGLRDPYTITNPVIYLVTQKSDNFQMSELYIPYTKDISREIYELTHERANLKSYQAFIDNDLRIIKEDFIQYSIVSVLYLFVYISLLYQSAFWFIEEFKKLLMIEYIFGKSKKERYRELYILNGVIYIVPFIINVLIMRISFGSVIQLYFLSICIEIMIMYIIIRKIERKNVGTILKGDYGL